MGVRRAVTLVICFFTVGLVGCGVDPIAAPPAEPEAKPHTADAVDTTRRYFLDRLVFWADAPFTPAEMHNRYVQDFIRKPGQGISRGFAAPPPLSLWIELLAESQGDRYPVVDRARDESAKYNALTETLTLPDGTSHSVRERVWQLQTWNLMSVNAESGPVVYSADAHRKDDLSNINLHDLMKSKMAATGATAPKRPLDAFETAGLAKLRAGEEVVVQSQGPEMRVLGAVRARTECVACHKVDVGTTLGAFTYTLKLQCEETPAADRLTDTAGLTDRELGAVRVIESLGGKVIRAPGGPVTELQLTFARSREMQTNPRGITTRLALHDSALWVVGAFPEVRTLDVSNSFVSDAGLKTIAESKQLKRIDLRHTRVSAEGIAALKQSLPACEITHDRDDSDDPE
jgi:hypothetical protein